jgi:serine/threonine protein kinase
MFASSLTMSPPGIGDVIAGKYELIRLLGRGSTGEVWLARHKTLGEDVAIKVLKQTLWTGEEEEERVQAAKRFRFEAQIAARLARKTRHIVRVTDHGETDGIAYLVMELLDGMTLEAKLAQREAFSPVEVQTLVRQVAKALDYAHAEGVLHRDLKPSNLFLTRGEDGEMLVKVLDFGIAQMMRSRTSTGAFSKDRQLIFGTPGYMSPEQALGYADLDGHCDLWALATIVYESLANELPVAGTSVHELISAVRSARTIPLSQYRPDLPKSVGEFFERAFLEDVDGRFATAAELTRAFDVAFATELPHDTFVAQDTDPPPAALPEGRPAGSDPHLPRRPRSMVTALWLAALVATGFVGATWRSLAPGVDRLAHLRVALAVSELPPAKTGVAGGSEIQTEPVKIPPLETVPMLAASAPIEEVKVTRRRHVTIPSLTSDVPTPGGGVARLEREARSMWTAVTSDARMSDPNEPPFSTATSEAPGAKPECDPPYFVDATGKKRWNLACL